MLKSIWITLSQQRQVGWFFLLKPSCTKANRHLCNFTMLCTNSKFSRFKCAQILLSAQCFAEKQIWRIMTWRFFLAKKSESANCRLDKTADAKKKQTWSKNSRLGNHANNNKKITQHEILLRQTNSSLKNYFSSESKKLREKKLVKQKWRRPKNFQVSKNVEKI